jgi:hypothetical protein
VLLMPRKFPFYLDQGDIDDLAQSLYKLQHLVDVASGSHPASDLPFRLLSDLRRQCCHRSRAEDPFPDLPIAPRPVDARVRSTAQC